MVRPEEPASGIDAALLAAAERTRVREYVAHTLYHPGRDLPALTLTRRYQPVLTEADVYGARPGSGDVLDMREHRRQKALAAAQAAEAAAGEDIGPAAGTSFEARALHSRRNMAENKPTELSALSAGGWKRYAERQLRDAIRSSPLTIEHSTVLLVVEQWLGQTDQQTIWDMGNAQSLRMAALHQQVTPDAIKKRRATALHNLLELLHEAGEVGTSPPPRRRAL